MKCGLDEMSSNEIKEIPWRCKFFGSSDWNIRCAKFWSWLRLKEFGAATELSDNRSPIGQAPPGDGKGPAPVFARLHS